MCVCVRERVSVCVCVCAYIHLCSPAVILDSPP